jgi:ABC-type transport system involved in multi-copper enzyme maturation permease subunit
MFISLLLITFVISFAVSLIVARVFHNPTLKILQRLITDEIHAAWQRYLTFAIYVVGISSGVRIWQLERYVEPATENAPLLVLNRDRWVLEIYRTIIETLQGLAWLLLVFFIFALIAYVIVRISEMKRGVKS